MHSSAKFRVERVHRMVLADRYVKLVGWVVLFQRDENLIDQVWISTINSFSQGLGFLAQLEKKRDLLGGPVFEI